MRKKVIIVLFGAVLLLIATGLTEYLFYRQNETMWVARFQERLHRQEAIAEQALASLQDSVDIDAEEWDADLIFVGVRQGKVFFWTNEIVGEAGLVERLGRGENFLKIGNTYYEVRHRKNKDADYYALLRIKDQHPYTGKYIKNKFGKFLKIAEENINQVDISLTPSSGGHLVADKDGNSLFYLVYGEHYKERASNFILLSMYLIFFLSLFYVYDVLLKGTSSWKVQLLYFAGFVLFLIGLRYFMETFRLPPSVYRLPIFDENISKDIFISSIGDLLISTFCIFQLIYITSSNLKINYQSERWRRYRYLFAAIIFLLIFLYIDFFNLAVDLVIENMNIHLNIARLIHVGVPSIIAFVAIIFVGLVIIISIYGAISVFHHMLSFKSVVRIATLMCLAIWLLTTVLELYTNFWDCFFVWIVSLLIAVNKYLLKKDIQRSVYVLVIFLLSIYIVMVTKKYEQYKEQRQRLGYATELIEERDYNFEKHLMAITDSLKGAERLNLLLAMDDPTEAGKVLGEELLDLTGYNYHPDITFCRMGDSLWLTDTHQEAECYQYFEQIILEHGRKIGETNFFSIDIFDGYVTYIGRFRYGNWWLYLRFDAPKDDEGLGYPQLLSRKSANENNNVYFYSYAKYAHGELVSSSGFFVYYKKMTAFGKYGQNVEIVQKDNYSHMLVPVDDNNTLVISLHESTFSLYYMNVLYVYFICILFSSYGLFFTANQEVRFRRGTLKAQIKNNIISLVFVLFVILTALSIYINTKSFEGRHNNKAIELLKYVNKELERLDCVDQRDCPEILNTLSNMSELLMIDINIYSQEGYLVATSRPEIFQNNFDGYFVNPKALKYIREEGATNYIGNEKIGELEYLSAYMPLVLDNGKSYLLNVPYFAQNDELNLDIIIMVVITVNIAIVVMVLAFILSGLVAERVTKPLQLLNEKLKKMRLGDKNEKIIYNRKDEVGMLVQEYNNMVDKLDESIDQLARSERENAWREMARQIAHEIKNPLTPMKLNIQFMLRSLQMEDSDKFKERFRSVSVMLIEQIDNLAAIASAFSDFAKMSEVHYETFDVAELVKNCTLLFENNVDKLKCEIEPEIFVRADKEQIRRVLVNLLKNAEQSIPENKKGRILVTVQKKDERVCIRIKDNGTGIPAEIQKNIFEPNFTTKTSGSGLGLAISRRIIDNMGGEIGFTTVQDEGTEFYILLDYYNR